MRIVTEAPSLPAVLARQEPHVLTQTIIREFTTFTTVVTLGVIPTNDPSGEPPSDESSSDSASAGGGGGGDGLNSLELGAILGSVFGVVVIVLLWYCCCYTPVTPRTSYEYRMHEYDSYRKSTGHVVDDAPTRPSAPRRPPPVAERIPGGPRYPTYRAIPIPNPRNPRVRHYP
ncbi:hypothetical protein S7711_05151 [Stachybotrys chartarum IBT 7711]|uniref:Mid2 domain-containing protein n=1 Tax=Stachybotrys chartarum (strain CBS 109288 / IBT 7711) TaxID=1280523 RepID=A0A084B4J7_STACB|nr:hypothetical protein S7711_05151 [Stachybotrys chartarum IBT 7711]KFA48342.1 hypothetical protein S40293_04456 [Stachybotrys chartarum IBT 40293]KFA72542.1 hypothetical protein S40288_08896 [Stachybotrys chartarum IBT 40288]